MAKSGRKDPIPLLEWVSAALGLAIAAGLLGILGLEAGRNGDGARVPILVAQIEGIEAAAGGHVARVVVTNRSGQTAARVEVEGKAGGETSSASIDYVPGHSQAEGGLLFQGDPRRTGLKVRVTGYQLP